MWYVPAAAFGALAAALGVRAIRVAAPFEPSAALSVAEQVAAYRWNWGAATGSISAALLAAIACLLCCMLASLRRG
jgi:hypothetical protein